MATSPEFSRFMLSPNVDLPAKLQGLFQLISAYLYRGAPVLTLAASVPFLLLWSLMNLHLTGFANIEGPLVLLAFPFGATIGMLVTYVRGGRALSEIGGTVLSPTVRSFLPSLLWSVSPAASVVLAGLVLGPEHRNRLIFQIPSALMILLAILLIIQDIVVHRQKLIILPEGLALSNGRSVHGVLWSDIDEIGIRERRNRISGTDRLISAKCASGRPFAYPISVLSQRDQEKILLAIRRKSRTKTDFDKGVL